MAASRELRTTIRWPKALTDVTSPERAYQQYSSFANRALDVPQRELHCEKVSHWHLAGISKTFPMSGRGFGPGGKGGGGLLKRSRFSKNSPPRANTALRTARDSMVSYHYYPARGGLQKPTAEWSIYTVGDSLTASRWNISP